jgi:hypothetical protein
VFTRKEEGQQAQKGNNMANIDKNEPQTNNSPTDAKTQPDTSLEPNMMMLNRDMVVRLAEQHRLAITIRPDGSIFGLSHHLDRLRTLVKDELTRAAAMQAGGAA